MNEFEKILEQLQDLSHEIKTRIMWIGVPIVMAIIVFIWFSFTDFSFSARGWKKDTGVEPSDSFSKLEILKKGFSETLKDAGNLLKDFKEKINQTNTFIIEPTSEKISDVSTTSLEVATTTTN